MTTDPSLWSTALQLGIGGLSVAGIIYVSLTHSKTSKETYKEFLHQMQETAQRHAVSMMERETAMREVEKNIRTTLAEQIVKNTTALVDATRVLGRVVRHLDGELR